jgi:hypothetical protein
MILILTRAEDYHHSNAVIEVLKRKGAAYVRFETARFPREARLTLSYSGRSTERTLVLDEQRVDLDLVTTVWNRRPLPPLPSLSLTAEDRDFVRDESRHFIRGVWHLLADRFWVNAYLADRAAHAKPFQLRVAQEVGLTIPRTLLTNSPSDARAFFEECGGAIVYKTFTGYVRDAGHTGYGIYTNRVSREELLGRLDGVAQAPCQFQEYLEKRLDLRVTVIGRNCFACEIHSQATEHTADDWRRCGPEWDRLQHTRTTLPASVEQQIFRLMDRLGLVFGCLDSSSRETTNSYSSRSTRTDSGCGWSTPLGYRSSICSRTC